MFCCMKQSLALLYIIHVCKSKLTLMNTALQNFTHLEPTLQAPGVSFYTHVIRFYPFWLLTVEDHVFRHKKRECISIAAL